MDSIRKGMLKTFEVIFLNWIRKVGSSLDQCYLVCENQIIGNRSIAPQTRNIAVFAILASFCCIRDALDPLQIIRFTQTKFR